MTGADTTCDDPGRDWDAYLHATQRAALGYADDRIAALARSVRHWLQKMPASGIFNFSFKTVWDEYCYEIQEGPSPDRWAFELTIYPYIENTIVKLPRSEALLLSSAAIFFENDEWEADEFRAGMPFYFDGMRRLLEQRINAIAMDRALDRFSELQRSKRVLRIGRTDYHLLLARRLEALLARADDPKEAMNEIASAAAAGGLIDSDALPRRSNPTDFVTDLLTDNPLAADLIRIKARGARPSSLRSADLEQLGGFLR